MQPPAICCDATHASNIDHCRTILIVLSLRTRLCFEGHRGIDLGNDHSAGPGSYAELAVRIHAMAATATDPETTAELTGLAARYERLAGLAAQMVDKYAPLASEPPRRDGGSNLSALSQDSDGDS